MVSATSPTTCVGCQYIAERKLCLHPHDLHHSLCVISNLLNLAPHPLNWSQVMSNFCSDQVMQWVSTLPVFYWLSLQWTLQSSLWSQVMCNFLWDLVRTRCCSGSQLFQFFLDFLCSELYSLQLSSLQWAVPAIQDAGHPGVFCYNFIIHFKWAHTHFAAGLLLQVAKVTLGVGLPVISQFSLLTSCSTLF